MNAQYISVDTQTYTAEELVKNVFFGSGNSNCIVVENVQMKGHDFGNNERSFGYFNRNGSDFEMDKGILLSTGNAVKAVGPNNYIQSFYHTSWLGDQDLEIAVRTQNTHNATILEFDFTPLKNNKISFEYLFASEQYLRRQDTGSCDYTDGFAFLIKESGTTDPYQNLAVLPGTAIPIKSNTVRGGGEKCSAVNEEYFGHYNSDESPTNFNGQTAILTATTDVIPGVKYHLKLVIADQGNGLYDSGVFLKAGSFLGNIDIGNDRLFSTGTALCENTTLLLDSAVTGADSYQWFKNGVLIPGENSASYSVTSGGKYEVQVDEAGCKSLGSITVEYTEKPIVLEKSFCNYNNGAVISINLQDLNSEIISNYKPYFKVKYFQDSDHLISLPNTFNFSDDVTIYVQVESGNCTAENQVIHLNTPKKSLILQDQIICPTATTRLVAESGFKYYKWLSENGEIIAEGPSNNFIDDIPVGKYFVALTSRENCVLEQEVNVKAADPPHITNIEVIGNTATVFVLGGNPPYQYSLDNNLFQDSNVFSNVSRGSHTVYVKDSKNCEVIFKEFLIINLVNVITPNDDGLNDVLDYSNLKIKEEVKIEIYNRFGNQVFQGKNQQFIWDGKISGRALPTGTYWYILNWIEPDTNLPVSYKGWVLLKNRN